MRPSVIERSPSVTNSVPSRPEHQPAAEVQRRGERRRLVEDDLDVLDLRRRAVDELAARDRGVVHHVLARLGVAPVDQLVLLERRIERDVEQAALAARVNRRQAGHRLRHLLAVGADHAQPSRLLGDEHLAVGQERQAPRVDEPFGDGDDVELEREPRLLRAAPRPAGARGPGGGAAPVRGPLRGRPRRRPAPAPPRPAPAPPGARGGGGAGGGAGRASKAGRGGGGRGGGLS